MIGLVRIDNPEAFTHGWQARIYLPLRRGDKRAKYRSKFYSDKRYGPRRALEGAKLFLTTNGRRLLMPPNQSNSPVHTAVRKAAPTNAKAPSALAKPVPARVAATVVRQQGPRRSGKK